MAKTPEREPSNIPRELPRVSVSEHSQVEWPNISKAELVVSRMYRRDARLGKYLLVGRMAKIRSYDQLKRDHLLADRAFDAYVRNIAAHGWEALAHLCLPFTIYSALVSADMETIEQLRRSLENHAIRNIKGIGPKTVARVAQTLDEWDHLPAAFPLPPTDQTPP